MNPPSETKGTKWQVSKPSPFKVCRNGQGDLARRTRPDWPFGVGDQVTKGTGKRGLPVSRGMERRRISPHSTPCP